MAEAATSQSQRKSWRPLLWGLAAFLIVPQLPLFQLTVPVSETLLLLIPVVAVCAMLGWLRGGRIALPIILVALSAWILVQSVGAPGTPYDLMTRGWAIVLASSFGLLSILWSATTPFLIRGLAAVAVATAVGFIIALSAPSGIARFEHASGEELTQRASATIAKMQVGMSTPEWRQLAEKVPGVDTMNDEAEDVMRALPDKTASFLPALLALESLAALALGWGIYD